MPIRISRGAAATVSFSTPQQIVISSVDDSIQSWTYDGIGNPINSMVEDAQRGLLVARLPAVTSYYAARVRNRQTAATASGNSVWAMTNPVGSLKDVYIERIQLSTAFDGTTLVGNTLLSYLLARFTGGTPTGGTVVSAVPMNSSDPASVVTDIRMLNTGLTIPGGLVFGPAFSHFGIPSVQGSTNFYTRDNIGIKLAPGEGLTINLTATASAGQSVEGEVLWSERV